MRYTLNCKVRSMVGPVLVLVLVLALACGAPVAPAAPEATADPAAPPVVGSAPTPVPEPATEPEPPAVTSGGHLPMVAIGSPSSGPMWNQANPSFWGTMFNTLVEYDVEQPDPTVLRGNLAESWEVLDGGQTYIFHLHQDARWWDGEPVTAADVAFSLDAMVCPECFEILQGQFRSGNIMFPPHYEAGNSRAIDEKTVEVTLRFPVLHFPQMLAIGLAPIGPRHTILDQGKVQRWDKPEDLNGSGPFMLARATRDVSSEFVKNPDYWKKGYPRVDSMTHYIIRTPGTAAAAFQTEQVLMANHLDTPFNTLQAAQLEEDMAGRLTMHWMGPGGLFALITNTKRAPFDDVRVRRAVYLALHRQPIIEVLSGGRYLLGTPLPPDQWYSYPSEEAAQMPGFRELDGQKHPDDVAEARRLLVEGGYPANLRVEIISRDAGVHVDVVSLIAAQLRTFLDWDVRVRMMEPAAESATRDRGDYQLFVHWTSYNLDDPDAALLRYEMSKTHTAWCGGMADHWNPPGLQGIIESVASEGDRERRKELMQQGHDILLNQDNCNLGLYWFMWHMPVNNKVQGYYPHPFMYANRYEHLWVER